MRGLGLGCAVAVGAALGCYAPAAAPGAPCSPAGSCPDGQICVPSSQTCQLALRDAGSQPPPPDGALPPECAGVAPPKNDGPSGALDVTAGGMFDIDLTCASADDDAPVGCGKGGERDVFFEVTLDKPETIYADTLDGDIPTELRIYPGVACGGTPNGYTCTTGGCGTQASQGAATLPKGTSCIVVAQRSPTTAIGTSRLHVIRGGRAGTQLLLQSGVATVTDNTCTNGTTQTTTSCGAASSEAKDLSYYALVCATGSVIDATTCGAGTFDDNLVVAAAPTTELACYDDGMLCAANASAAVVQNVAVPGPGLAWVVVDGSGSGATSCGPFTLTVTVH